MHVHAEHPGAWRPFPRASIHHHRPMCFLVAVCPFVSCRGAVQAQPVPSMVALEYRKDDTPTFGKAQSPSCPFSPLSLQKSPSMQRPGSSWGVPFHPWPRRDIHTTPTQLGAKDRPSMVSPHHGWLHCCFSPQCTRQGHPCKSGMRKGVPSSLQGSAWHFVPARLCGCLPC